MKLGEALTERARLQRKIGELRVRIGQNVTVQEDATVAENAGDLIAEAVQTHANLSELIRRINLTNAQTEHGGRTLTAMLAERDRLAGLIATYRGAASAAAGESGPRYLRSELKLTRLVDVPALHRAADELSGEMRTLDNEIQEVNWTVDLI